MVAAITSPIDEGYQALHDCGRPEMKLEGDGDVAVVIAVRSVRVVQVPVDQVVDVTAVGHGLVTASGAVYVVAGVGAAGVRALVGFMNR